MLQRVSICALLAVAAISVPTHSSAASKEILELQRELATLQQQVKDLQKSQDEKLATMQTLVKETLDAANRANTNVAVIQSNLQQNLQGLEGKVVAPVVGIGTRIGQVSDDLRTLQQSVSDLTSLMSRMQAQLTDLNAAVKVMQAPPAAPPPNSPTGPGGAPAATDAPTISASDLYANALRDRSSGKLELALQEFADYLKWYGNTDLAPNAQFYVAFTHYGQGRYEDAIREFDMVLEKYPDNNKTAEALLYKGRSLVRMPGHRNEGSDEFRELIKRYPNTDQAKQACSELQTLGLRCGPPAAASKGGVKKAASKRR